MTTDASSSLSAEPDDEMQARLRLVFVSAVLLVASLLTLAFRPDQQALGGFLSLLSAGVITWPILREVIRSIKACGFEATKFYMDQYVLLALAACLATGKYVTGALVAIILVIGQMLEERTVIGVEGALRRLRQMSRGRARKLSPEGLETEVDAETLQKGDRIRLRPGDQVPADAHVVSGHSSVNQAIITGESLPVDICSGSSIFAGTLNLTGMIEAEVSGAGSATMVAKVEQIIQEAKTSEAPIIRMAEDYARHYTPLVILIAASVFFFTESAERAISVLIVSIPCAFVLASPAAMVGAISAASRMGLLIKSSRHLEHGRKIDTVVFDKTGTLTEGRLYLEHTAVFDSIPRTDALALARALEQHSTHPIALALTRGADESGCERLEALHLTEAPGRGLSGKVSGRDVRVGRLSWLQENGCLLKPHPTEADRCSLVGLAVDGQHVATFGFSDRIRPEARQAIEALRQRGISQLILLSGDRDAVVRHVAGYLGVPEFRSEQLPDQKRAVITELKARGRHVMVVGDGLNDAPALASGDIGVAMGALGNDVAVNTADVALMSTDLRRLADLLELSSRTIGIVNQNLLCGFLFILIAITLSSLGFVNPIAAAFFHEFSAFFVLFNSARLLRFEPHA